MCKRVMHVIEGRPVKGCPCSDGHRLDAALQCSENSMLATVILSTTCVEITQDVARYLYLPPLSLVIDISTQCQPWTFAPTRHSGLLFRHYCLRSLGTTVYARSHYCLRPSASTVYALSALLFSPARQYCLRPRGTTRWSVLLTTAHSPLLFCPSQTSQN